MRKILKQNKLRKQLIKEAAVSATTLGAVTFATYSFLPTGLFSVGVLAGHEMAHFSVAKALGCQAQLPYFVPVGPIVFGRTKIKGLNDCSRVLVSMAGPSAGILLSMASIACGSIISSPLVILIGLSALFMEIFNAIIGRDGRVFRESYSRIKDIGFTNLGN